MIERQTAGQLYAQVLRTADRGARLVRASHTSLLQRVLEQAQDKRRRPFAAH